MRGDRLAPFVYLDGPADLDPDHEAGRLRGQPFLVGADAVRGGALDMARVGTATLRITSDAYKVQTLYTIARSLPKSLTHEVPDGKRYQKPKAVVEADVIYPRHAPYTRRLPPHSARLRRSGALERRSSLAPRGDVATHEACAVATPESSLLYIQGVPS
ncbi:hypothetical protein CJ255_17750 [Candidatus Viridilinea mediisalina]|uniref:Uncharacterized protein n=2 Tax=Candidatus Viridilinea mediisalina TaxID=2024553 RepID=A0A2A6RFA7_9CHLR|nr:hypothetical protein CJ255_17750 [Candidatus Viridilinea mediisalina]